MKEILYIIAFTVTSHNSIPCSPVKYIDPITKEETFPPIITLQHCTERVEERFELRLLAKEYKEWKEDVESGYREVKIQSLIKLENNNLDTIIYNGVHVNARTP